eukprot:496144-Pleurochrysis_carterae.AAC.2
MRQAATSPRKGPPGLCRPRRPCLRYAEAVRLLWHAGRFGRYPSPIYRAAAQPPRCHRLGCRACQSRLRCAILSLRTRPDPSPPPLPWTSLLYASPSTSTVRRRLLPRKVACGWVCRRCVPPVAHPLPVPPT